MTLNYFRSLSLSWRTQNLHHLQCKTNFCCQRPWREYPMLSGWSSGFSSWVQYCRVSFHWAWLRQQTWFFNGWKLFLLVHEFLFTGQSHFSITVLVCWRKVLTFLLQTLFSSLFSGTIVTCFYAYSMDGMAFRCCVGPWDWGGGGRHFSFPLYVGVGGTFVTFSCHWGFTKLHHFCPITFTSFFHHFFTFSSWVQYCRVSFHWAWLRQQSWFFNGW
jgi:hypothetical protein